MGCLGRELAGGREGGVWKQTAIVCPASDWERGGEIGVGGADGSWVRTIRKSEEKFETQSFDFRNMCTQF